MSYPFGSGNPHQTPYPPSHPQQSFGGGAPYPPQQAVPGPGYPPHPGYPAPNPQAGGFGQPPQGYPSQGFAPGYPPQTGAYPPQTGAYPPQTGAYPPQTGAYPPQTGAYPPQSAQPGYPPQSAPGYPPAHQNPGYPAQSGAYQGYPPADQPPAGYPMSSGFPGQPQQHQPHQPSSGHSAPYPGAHQTSAPVAGMAGCFTEMRQTVNSIHSENRMAKGNPTVRPAQPFQPADDAKALRKAMKGFGTDEDVLIQILCHRTNDQIQQIKRDYKVSFGRDLEADVKSEVSGKFEQVLVALLMPRIDYYVHELSTAIEGAGTDEDAIIEMLCSLSNYEIHLIKEAFHRTYHLSLESQLMSETSGHFRKLLVSLCTGNRDESGHVDPARAKQDAVELQAAGVGQAGTDESVFNGVVCQRNYAQLRLICEEYQCLTGDTLVKAIESEFSGDIKDGLKAIVRCVSNRSEFFAKCLYKSMAGLGTNDGQLIRLLVTRCEIDMADIKVAFQQKYGKTLRSFIQGDASGHYKHALYHLIGEKASE